MITLTTEQIRELIRQGRTEEFYWDRRWKSLAHDVRKEQHNECQICAAHGQVTRAWGVHHVRHLEDFPELAYSRHYTGEDGRQHRQLIAICFRCHELQHPERQAMHKHRQQLNAERW